MSMKLNKKTDPEVMRKAMSKVARDCYSSLFGLCGWFQKAIHPNAPEEEAFAAEVAVGLLVEELAQAIRLGGRLS